MFFILALGHDRVAAEDAPADPKRAGLDMRYPADLREQVLGILENEQAAAIEPATGEPPTRKPMPSVVQPLSVLPAMRAALSHIDPREFDLDVLVALGDIGALTVSGVGNECWIHLTPRGEAAAKDVAENVKRLQAAFSGDEQLKERTSGVRVESMETRRDPENRAKRLRIRFDLAPTKARAPETVPATVSPERVAAHIRSDEALRGNLQKEVKRLRSATGRHRTEVRQLLFRHPADDPRSLLSALARFETALGLTVAEVRYSRDRYHLAGTAEPTDGAIAAVQVAVRHPWIASNDLRGDMDGVIRARSATESPPSERLRVSCDESAVSSLARLLSASGIVVQHDGKTLQPTSPPSIALGPSEGALLGGLVEVLDRDGMDIEFASGGGTRLFLVVRQDLPREGLDLSDETAINLTAETALMAAWEDVKVHPFLKKRMGHGDVMRHERQGTTSPGKIGVETTIKIELRGHDELGREAATPTNPTGEALAAIHAACRRLGLGLRVREDRDDVHDFAEGLVRRAVSLVITADDLGHYGARDALLAIERVPGVAVDHFTWGGGSRLSVSLTMHQGLWRK